MLLKTEQTPSLPRSAATFYVNIDKINPEVDAATLGPARDDTDDKGGDEDPTVVVVVPPAEIDAVSQGFPPATTTTTPAAPEEEQQQRAACDESQVKVATPKPPATDGDLAEPVGTVGDSIAAAAVDEAVAVTEAVEEPVVQLEPAVAVDAAVEAAKAVPGGSDAGEDRVGSVCTADVVAVVTAVPDVEAAAGQVDGAPEAEEAGVDTEECEGTTATPPGEF